MLLEGRVAFVTGGASGIGYGLVQNFLKLGMKVVAVDFNQAYLQEKQQALAGRTDVHFLHADVGDRDQLRAAADEAIRKFGKIHVLCNNAGVGGGGDTLDADFEAWDRALRINLGGVVNGVKIITPLILRHGEGGHIVNTSSMAGVVPIPGAAIYITAKAAVIGLSEALRSELAGEGIGVSAFCPGPVQTNIREGGRVRPERYADSGYIELERELEERPNSPLWMSPHECGERVLEGIRRDDLYIFTHREFREGADERFHAMLASFPDEPLAEERAEAIRFLLSNPVFREVLDRRSV